MGTGQNLGTLLFTLKDHIVIQAVFFLKANLHRMNRELQEKLRISDHESATNFCESATTRGNQRPRISDHM